jgi:hypothetical protein
MLKRLLIITLSIAVPLAVSAACGPGQVCIATGVNSSVPSVLAGLVNVLFGWATLVAVALFMLGSILMVGSGGEEKFLSSGKAIMKASMIGFAIVLSSWLILSTVIYFIIS